MADVAHQFDDMAQQAEAASMGMWIFLATEVMFFGGLFLGYTVYRFAYPSAFAEASRHMNVLVGTTNTVVLICSSLTMALAVRAASKSQQKELVRYLILTMILGTLFLIFKGYEYHEHWVD